jgi:CubicO group peptidase (beta-lactamase class C family)
MTRMRFRIRTIRTMVAAVIIAIAVAALAVPPHGGSTTSKGPAKPVLPVTISSPRLGEGTPVFDQIVNDALKARHIPGAALAIVKDGKLVVARGYGMADTKTKEPVSLDTLFSTASITKTITAVAALRLVDQGKLSLDDAAYPLLDKPSPLGRAAFDPQVQKITVRQLLLHSGGWNSKLSGDVLRQTQKIARLTGEKRPLSAETVTRYGLSRPLDFVPGSASHYSNFCYFLAKRVVEKAARLPYESYVRQQVLAPLGVDDMRLEQLAPAYAAHEAHRYRNDGQELPGGREQITAPAGSWLATVVDLARFTAATDAGDRNPLLSANARQEMFALPPPPLGKRKSGSHVGLGWDVVRDGADGLEYHKSGNSAGIRTYIEHCGKDIDWVLLLNSDGTPDGQTAAVTKLVEQIRQAIDATVQWPDRDLFQNSPAVAKQ